MLSLPIDGARRNLRYRLFFGALAIAGSIAYGGSLATVFPSWRPSTAALWLTLSAGLSWPIFGVILVRATRRSLAECADACLVTMACGIAVLMVGAVANLIHLSHPWPAALAFNGWLIAMSNIVMATALARRLLGLGIPIWKSLAAWLFGLDLTGAILFRLFDVLLTGGSR
jgi:hypothetical protein